jgi:cystathionine beta-lyase/cystathionine gamma-synthase
VEPGERILATEHIYGGTYRLFERVLKRYRVVCEYVDTSRPELVEAAITPETRMLFVETPTNPTLRLTDLTAIAGIANARGLTLAVDNTFASPYVQRPLDHGAHMVVHSTTKYLNGHSDSVGGIVAVARPEDADRLSFVQNTGGAILGPFDSWLVLRGTKTLALRMARHNTNGLALATFLAAHPKVTAVHYPGLPSHPQHALAARQMNGFGGMLAFDVGSREAAARLLGRVSLISLAESLGGVETLVAHPASMSHASMPPDVRARLGITDGLVRLSAGIEDIDDLRDDLAQALEAV